MYRKNSFLLTLFFVSVISGSAGFITSDWQAQRHTQVASVSDANTDTTKKTSSSNEGCSDPNVVCKYSPTSTPQPVGACVNPPNEAIKKQCETQKAIGAKQITSGIGSKGLKKQDVSPPTITTVQYSPTECKVATSVGSGKCNPNATQKCPTALTAGTGDGKTKSCFWEQEACKKVCVNTNSDSTKKDGSLLNSDGQTGDSGQSSGQTSGQGSGGQPPQLPQGGGGGSGGGDNNSQASCDISQYSYVGREPDSLTTAYTDELTYLRNVLKQLPPHCSTHALLKRIEELEKKLRDLEQQKSITVIEEIAAGDEEDEATAEEEVTYASDDVTEEVLSDTETEQGSAVVVETQTHAPEEPPGDTVARAPETEPSNNAIRSFFTGIGGSNAVVDALSKALPSTHQAPAPQTQQAPRALVKAVNTAATHVYNLVGSVSKFLGF